MTERVAEVEYVWDDEPDGKTYTSLVVILNDSEEYDRMVEEEDFDNRIFFYFRDEEEFESAFSPEYSGGEFHLVRDLSAQARTDYIVQSMIDHAQGGNA
jgi:hypothetical protein